MDRPKVLIVDDSRFMRRVVKNTLTSLGANCVAEADCAVEAVEKYKEYHPDVVTMDITMTSDGTSMGRSSNGIDAIKKIIEYDASAKIIVVSAMGQKHFVVEAIECGAKDFVVKPFTEEKLAEAYYSVIGKEK